MGAGRSWACTRWVHRMALRGDGEPGNVFLFSRVPRRMTTEEAQGRLPFEYETAEDDGTITSHGGLPLVAETMRALGISEAARRELKQPGRRREHDAALMVEAFVTLMAMGGECLDDFKLLVEDSALRRLMDRSFPSPETARRFLYGFHDDALVQKAAEELPAGEVAYVPEENEWLRGLGRVLERSVMAVQERHPVETATVDLDATIQESHKREAKFHYEGGRGYQPEVAIWAEQDLVIGDEFRDGNVPAGKDTLRLTQRAFAALPKTVKERRFRGDSACYNEPQIKWLAGQEIAFTISADMGKDLRAVCQAVEEDNWRLLEQRADEEVHVTEVVFCPGDWRRDAAALRYLALRFTPKQGKLFEDGAGPKYLAVVTNREGTAEELIRWHWGKAGTIERVHDIVKNELGGGVLPCGRFGANAAWFRLALLTFNVLTALKVIGLPPEMKEARPKRLRLHVLTLPAQVVSHSRQLWARLVDRAHRAVWAVLARRRIWKAVPLPAG